MWKAQIMKTKKTIDVKDKYEWKYGYIQYLKKLNSLSSKMTSFSKAVCIS